MIELILLSIFMLLLYVDNKIYQTLFIISIGILLYLISVNSKKSRNKTLLFIKNQRKDHQILTLSTNGMKKIGGGVTMYDSAITEENQANLKTKPPPFLVRVCFSGGPTRT